MHAPTLTRREFTASILGGMMTYSVLESAFDADAFAAPVQPITDYWSKRLNELANDVKGAKITAVQWQDMTHDLFNKVELEELLTFIDFARVKEGFEYPDAGPKQVHVKFPQVEGLPTEYIYDRKIFGLKQGRAIMPHSHINMCTMHMVIEGELDLKHYDRVGDEGSHLIVRPTIDRKATVGTNSTISDARDNIHWFKALTPVAHTFDIVVWNIDATNETDGKLEWLDAAEAEPAGDGQLRMAKMEYGEAVKKYGKEMHH